MENPIIEDYSKPQQGTMTSSQSFQQPKVFKVPPTRRDDRKLFVGGLPSNVTDEEFLEFFSQFGTVVDAKVMFDRDTGRSRGFGFVTFEDSNVCTLLLNMCVEGTEGQGRVQMRGKVCEIKAAQPKESSNNSGGGTSRGRRGSGGNKGYRSYPQQVYPTNEQAAVYHHQGYPQTNGDGTVNQGVPSTLPGQPVMYSPYGMSAYYTTPAVGMHGGTVYNPYMGGYSQEAAAAAAAYYDHHGGMDAYVHMPSVMTATPPGPHAQQQNAAYGNGFVPVGGDNPEASTPAETRQVTDESPQGTNTGEEPNHS
jgi:RNA-binding protein Musashi